MTKTEDLIKEERSILIVSQEAGGAEILSAWVKQHIGEHKFGYCLKEPALSIFQRKLGRSDNISDMNISSIVKQYELILSGTGYPSTHERNILSIAKMVGIRTITFLDHWVNYRERFGYPEKDWGKNLPDEVWVGDEYALDIARESGFPLHKLKLVKNPFFKEVMEEAKSKQAISQHLEYNRKIRVLYICEPITEFTAQPIDKDAFGFTEFDAIKNFLSDLKTIADKVEEVRIRLHPYEREGKYNKHISEFEGKIRISMSDKKTSLIDDCVWADVVVGMESMGLVIGLLAGKKVISCIPQGRKECSLPQEDIIRCNRLTPLLYLFDQRPTLNF